MSETHTDKLFNKVVDERFGEIANYISNPDSLVLGAKASEAIQIKKAGPEFEFSTLSWDFTIVRKINVFKQECILETNRLILDRNNYPNKIAVAIPDMDIQIRFPLNAPESFRFVKDDIRQQVFKDMDGNPLTVDINAALIRDFPLQYLNKLYLTMQNMQTKS